MRYGNRKPQRPSGRFSRGSKPTKGPEENGPPIASKEVDFQKTSRAQCVNMADAAFGRAIPKEVEYPPLLAGHIVRDRDVGP